MKLIISKSDKVAQIQLYDMRQNSHSIICMRPNSILSCTKILIVVKFHKDILQIAICTLLFDRFMHINPPSVSTLMWVLDQIMNRLKWKLAHLLRLIKYLNLQNFIKHVYYTLKSSIQGSICMGQISRRKLQNFCTLHNRLTWKDGHL